MYHTIYGNHLRAAILRSSLMVLMVISSVTQAVVWEGADTPNVIADVAPVSLILNNGLGDIILTNTCGPVPDYVQINALNFDVTVTMNGNSSTVITSGTSPAMTLFLTASPNKKITFNFNSDTLEFRGSTGTTNPLVIVVSGGGDVIFNFGSGMSMVRIGTNYPTNSPVELYVLMKNDGTHGNLVFRNGTSVSGMHALTVNAQSVLGYLSQNLISAGGGGDIGYVTWISATDSTNSQFPFGLFLMNQARATIEGAFYTGVVPGVECDATPVITAATINPDIPTGSRAIFNSEFDPLYPGLVSSGMIILNANNTLPQLRANPFLQPAPFNGRLRYGFVMGANSLMQIAQNSYMVNVGFTDNQCPDLTAIPGFSIDPQSLVKQRNPSALFIDGLDDPAAVPATIAIGDTDNELAGLYFESIFSVFFDGDQLADPFLQWAIAMGVVPAPFSPLLLPGIGAIVFDVEAPLLVEGKNTVDAQYSGIQIISLALEAFGGELFVGDNSTLFPERTFATSDLIVCDEVVATFPASFQKIAFLINNDQVYFKNVSLIHTDELHYIGAKDDVLSEPTYVGGETWQLLRTTTDCSLRDVTAPRPAINFINARFNLNTSAAVTGLDLNVPNVGLYTSCVNDIAPCTVFESCVENVSKFVFFYNGFKIDQGNGRNLILGTTIGSKPCDPCCATVSADAHLNVIQTEGCNALNHLLFQTSPNDDSVTQGIPSASAIDGQLSSHDLYLGHNSNVSIGRQVTPCIVIPCDQID